MTAFPREVQLASLLFILPGLSRNAAESFTLLLVVYICCLLDFNCSGLDSEYMTAHHTEINGTYFLGHMHRLQLLVWNKPILFSFLKHNPVYTYSEEKLL